MTGGLLAGCGSHPEPQPPPIEYRTPDAFAASGTAIAPRIEVATPQVAIATPKVAITTPPKLESIEAAAHPSGIDDWLRAAGWPESLLGEARAIVACESAGRPDAVSSEGAAGLFQVMPFWADVYGLPYSALFAPITNAQVARWIYERSGTWGAWQCKPSG